MVRLTVLVDRIESHPFDRYTCTLPPQHARHCRRSILPFQSHTHFTHIEGATKACAAATSVIRRRNKAGAAAAARVEWRRIFLKLGVCPPVCVCVCMRVVDDRKRGDKLGGRDAMERSIRTAIQPLSHIIQSPITLIPSFHGGIDSCWARTARPRSLSTHLQPPSSAKCLESSWGFRAKSVEPRCASSIASKGGARAFACVCMHRCDCWFWVIGWRHRSNQIIQDPISIDRDLLPDPRHSHTQHASSSPRTSNRHHGRCSTRRPLAAGRRAVGCAAAHERGLPPPFPGRHDQAAGNLWWLIVDD